MRDVQFGPDAARYWIAAQGRSVARPFNLRWLLPAVCGTSLRRWWAVWALSWPVLGCGMFWLASDLGWQRAAFAAVVVLGLPGVWGPHVVRPVGVDLPAMALGVVGAAAAVHGWWWLAVIAVAYASMVKESAPLWAALWAWNPVLLLALVFPAAAALVIRPKIDEVTGGVEVLRRVHDHPILTAYEHRAGRYRDFWLWVAPWGIGLAALYRPSWQLVVVLVVAHLQVLVATDTVRLVQTAAGPAVAVAAASVLPTAWLPLAALVAVFWWRLPETQ